MSSEKLIYAKDVDGDGISGYFKAIREKNAPLYDSIMDNLKKESSMGIREDVLEYVSDHADEFSRDSEYAFNIAAFMGNIKLSAEYFAWINRYFTEINKIAITDFVIVFDEAVEKDIPLESIMEFFSADESDVLKIYEKVDNYAPEKQSSGADEDDVPGEPDEQMHPEEHAEHTPAGVSTQTVSTDENEGTQGNGSEMADMFRNLLTVMTYSNRENGSSVLSVQDNINAILAKFQVTVSELTSYATNIVRDWEKDKEEIERLKALNEIQQKVISNQQTKINEMRNQLVRTNEKLQAVKLSEMKSEAIKQKISELDSLASEIAHPFDPSMNLLETF